MIANYKLILLEYPKEFHGAGRPMSNIRVELTSEDGTSTIPAEVHVYEGEKLVAHVLAQVKWVQGADGKQYPRVLLTNLQQH